MINYCENSEDFSKWAPTNGVIALPGTKKLEDANATEWAQIEQYLDVPTLAQSWTFSMYIKKDTDESRFPEIQLWWTGQYFGAQLNTKTGATVIRKGVGTASSQDTGNYWRFIQTMLKDNVTSSIRVRIFPSVGGPVFGTIAQSSVGSIIAYGAQLEPGTEATEYMDTTPVPGDRNRPSISPSDLNRLEALLASRNPPLTLEDVRFYFNEGSGMWRVFESSIMLPTLARMQWKDGNWEMQL